MLNQKSIHNFCFFKLTVGDIERGPSEIEREVVLFVQEKNKI